MSSAVTCSSVDRANRSQSSLSPPPITTISGSVRMHRFEMPSASQYANSSSTPSAAVSPWRAAAVTSGPRNASPSRSTAIRSSAEPDAYISQQPRRPQAHWRPPASTIMCPGSPASPPEPRSTSPFSMNAPPMPVPSDTMTPLRTPRAAPAAISHRAAQFTSLSRNTGMSSRPLSPDPISAPSTSVRLGETVTRPSSVIKPAIPTPTETGRDPGPRRAVISARAAMSGAAPSGVGSRRVRSTAPS